MSIRQSKNLYIPQVRHSQNGTTNHLICNILFFHSKLSGIFHKSKQCKKLLFLCKYKHIIFIKYIFEMNKFLQTHNILYIIMIKKTELFTLLFSFYYFDYCIKNITIRI